ncbi:MAG TPA: hypothetical protein V6C57_13560 [Coleofasciculaceae cyanobacterium]
MKFLDQQRSPNPDDEAFGTSPAPTAQSEGCIIEAVRSKPAAFVPFLTQQMRIEPQRRIELLSP